MKQRLLSLLLIGTVTAAMLAGCGAGNGTDGEQDADGTKQDASSETQKEDDAAEADSPDADGADTAEDGEVLKVAAFEGGYGADMWEGVAEAFEKSHPGVTVELTIDSQLEDAIGSDMRNGDCPDVVHLAVGREAALTETMTKENEVLAINDILDMTVPGENTTVRDKLIPGFADTIGTNPYGDGVMYYAPMFYSSYGIFYNAGLLEEKGWEVPSTWDEMWELGEKAKAEGIALFTYPAVGYLDSFIYALLSSAGGSEFYNKCMTYEDGIWESEDAAKVFDIVGRLAAYTESTTAENASNGNFTMNQQLILDNKAIFCPNGTWLPGEMASASKADGFEWGFMAVPAVNADGTGAAYVSVEQMWIPAKAENPDLAKEFIAYMYSDEAAAIFAKSGAVQPIGGMSEILEGDNKMFYGIFDNGAAAVTGGFTAAAAEGVSIEDALFGTVDRIMSGETATEEWKAAVEAASDQLRGA